MTDLGPLAAALAKARVRFPAIPRSKAVTTPKYTFTYAPLDAILDVVTGPLADQGLVVIQVLDDGSLVTTLLHESGAAISGRIDLPQAESMQALGSAITYLRRYALQAILGIAAEEDDDGSRGAGMPGSVKSVRADVERSDDGSLIGTVEVGDRSSSDYELRNTPDGPALGFRLRGQRGGILVRCVGPLAVQLHDNREAVVGSRVTCWGSVTDESFTPRGKKEPVTFQVLVAERISVPDLGTFPKESSEPPALTEAESEAIWSEMEKVAGA